MAARRRPRFLLDLAEELTWLNQKAGAEVAEHWYQALKESIRSSAGSAPISNPRVFVRGESAGFHGG